MTAPNPPRIAHDPALGVLDTYGLRPDLPVEVELLIAGGGGATHGTTMPRLVEGTVAGATTAVLILEAPRPRVVYRIPWAAIALIRTDNTPTHPAHQ